MDVQEGRLSQTMGMAIGAIGPIVVAGALVGVRDSVANADVGLLLVLVVVLAAVTGGWQAGAVGAVFRGAVVRLLPHEAVPLVDDQLP